MKKDQVQITSDLGVLRASELDIAQKKGKQDNLLHLPKFATLLEEGPKGRITVKLLQNEQVAGIVEGHTGSESLSLTWIHPKFRNQAVRTRMLDDACAVVGAFRLNHGYTTTSV